MKPFTRWTLKLMAPAVSAALALLIAGSTAQTPPAMPLVDLSIGPTAVNPQAVNIALALSVEFPTVGDIIKSIAITICIRNFIATCIQNLY